MRVAGWRAECHVTRTAASDWACVVSKERKSAAVDYIHAAADRRPSHL